jgi:hypothetical protein
MKTRRIFLTPLVLAFVSVQFAFGWGNATHVYFANHLGAKSGPANMNEMYGAVLPDLLNFELTPEGEAGANAFHNIAMPVWLAAATPAQKSLAFGFMTHNETWGADYTAHVGAPDFRDGYVIGKGMLLAPELESALWQILIDAGIPDPYASGFATELAPVFGHDLTETAVDVLVKRNIDKAIGPQIMIAAKQRSSDAGILLAAAYGLPEADIVDAERQYQEYIIQYGKAFTLPEHKTIGILSAQTVPVAEMFIEAALAGNGYPNVDVAVDPEQIAEFIAAAILNVESDYRQALAYTLSSVEEALEQNGINAGWPMFAHDATQEDAESVDECGAPMIFSLAQNTPNPFNPSTTINFSLPVQGHVRLTVFNALGQEVATLVDDARPAGHYAARWDAFNQPSGAYFCRIESGSFVETKRMMLLK